MTPLNCYSLIAVLFLLVPVVSSAKTISPSSKDTHSHVTNKQNEAKRHFVQFFSTISATKAEGMKNTLLTRGFPAFINIKSQQKGNHYQVHIGPFPSRDTANRAKLKVIQYYPQYTFLNAAILKSKL